MPELPEVETIVQELKAAGLQGLKINRTSVYWNRSLADQDPISFLKLVSNQHILDISRKGKFIVFTLTDRELLVHLRMTGKFYLDLNDSPPHPHERIRVYLSDGRILHYEDQRKFGKWYIAHTQEILAKIGIDPLTSAFSLEVFKRLLKQSKRMIKPFLLDQQHIAGIGNIYADEALWDAKIHPARLAHTLTMHEIESLHQAIQRVLKSGVENTGTTLGNARANYFSVSGRRGSHQHHLNVFRRQGMPCPRCGTLIQKIVLAQRGTHLCPKCQ